MIFFQIEIAQDYVTEPLMFFFCVGIAVKLVSRRRDTSRVQLTSKEKNAIYQVFTICISLMTMNFIYLVIPFMTSSKWAQMAGNTLWVIVSGKFEVAVMFSYYLFSLHNLSFKIFLPVVLKIL